MKIMIPGRRVLKVIPGRHPAHYETLPHNDCPMAESCDCDCDACIDAREGQILSEGNRRWYERHFKQARRILLAVPARKPRTRSMSEL